MSYYPRSLQYYLKSLNSYPRMKYKLTPGVSEDQSVSGGQTLVVNLPRNSIVDLSTFAWFFTGKTNEAGWALPKHIETIVSRVQVHVNYQVVDGGFRYYNLLFRRLADLTLGDKDAIRGVLQNTQGTAFTTLNGVASSNWAYATAVDAGSNNRPQQFCIDKWLGFLGSAQPNCIDTSILGDVAVHITLAGNHVLSKGTNGGATGTYTLTNNYFTTTTGFTMTSSISGWATQTTLFKSLSNLGLISVPVRQA